MTYYNQLHPWCIIQCLPQSQTRIIVRFRHRNYAEAHLRILQQLNPSGVYHLIFDLPERAAPAHTPTQPDPRSSISLPSLQTQQEHNPC